MCDFTTGEHKMQKLGFNCLFFWHKPGKLVVQCTSYIETKRSCQLKKQLLNYLHELETFDSKKGF